MNRLFINIYQVSDDIFEVTEFNVLVKFIRDATKRKVLGVRIIYKEGDVDIFGKKETDWIKNSLENFKFIRFTKLLLLVRNIGQSFVNNFIINCLIDN